MATMMCRMDGWRCQVGDDGPFGADVTIDVWIEGGEIGGRVSACVCSFRVHCFLGASWVDDGRVELGAPAFADDRQATLDREGGLVTKIDRPRTRRKLRRGDADRVAREISEVRSTIGWSAGKACLLRVTPGLRAG